MTKPPVLPARVTLQNVAQAAGLSPATVDRVLNGRDGVRGRTTDIVLDTDWSEIRAVRDPGLTIAVAQIERLRAEAVERPATPPPA